jgi:hypothetical protein
LPPPPSPHEQKAPLRRRRCNGFDALIAPCAPRTHLTKRLQLNIAAALLLASCHASALFAQTATAVDDRVEASVDYWHPSANIHAAGERYDILGTPIDFRSDFGLTNRGFPSMKLSVRPRARHELSLSYVPVHYHTSAILGHDVTFAGTVYPAGMSTQGTVPWAALGVGYSYYFMIKPRVSVGVRGEVDGTNVRVQLQNAVSTTSTVASVQIAPAGGLVARSRISSKLTLKGEFALLYVPDRPNQNYGGHYLNAEAHARWALTRHVGANLGYRLIDIRHLGHSDSGKLKLRGLSVGVLVFR